MHPQLEVPERAAFADPTQSTPPSSGDICATMDPTVLQNRLYKSEAEKEKLDLSAEDLGQGGIEIVAKALATVCVLNDMSVLCAISVHTEVPVPFLFIITST